MPVIETLVLGKSPEVAFGAAKLAYRAFRSQDPLGRLFVLLHIDFGQEANLDRDAFYSWRTQAELQEFLEEVLAGRRAREAEDVAALAELIEPRLVRTEQADRAGLAGRMAEAVVAVAPRVVEGGSEATQLIVARLEAGQQRLLKAIGDLDAGPEQAPDLARALLIGPLRHIKAVHEVEAAERLAAQGEQFDAADRLLAVAARLDGERLVIAAESLRERSVLLLIEAGAAERAIELLLEVAERRIARGSTWAVTSLAGAVEALPDSGWISEAIVAQVSWPEDHPRAIEALSAAVERSQGGGQRLVWLAAYVDLLSILGDHEAVASMTAEFATPPFPGERLRLALDRLDALEVTAGPDVVEAGWRELLRWADHEAMPADAATAYQRRAVVLSWRDDVEGADDAYRRAIGCWSSLPGCEEQAGDAFLSLQAAYVVNGHMPVPDMELRPMASALRGDAETPSALADRLVARGMSDRLAGRLPDALQEYWLAYGIQRRTGSLVGMLESIAVLAELYEHAGEAADALLLHVGAGQGDKAVALAPGVSPVVIAQRLRMKVPKWERAAAYQVVATVGRSLPVEFVAQILPQILSEARSEPTGLHAPQPGLRARSALAAIALGAPAEAREEVLHQLRAQLTVGPIDVIKASAFALILSANAGLLTDLEDLVTLYLADSYNFGVDPGWVAERAMEDPQIAGRLTEAAADGHRGALEALALGGLVATNPALVAACTTAIDDTGELTTFREERRGGMVERTFGLGVRFERLGVLARYAQPEARQQLLTKLLAVLVEPGEPETNRASAVDALGNMAAVLDDEQAQAVTDALEPLAFGRYGLSQVDRNDTHPLSRWRISLHIPNILRATAISTIGRLTASHSRLGSDLVQEAVIRGLVDGPELVIAAALAAASEVPELDLPFAPENALDSSEVRIRRTAFEACLARDASFPNGGSVAMLRRDPDAGIRVRLVEALSRQQPMPATLLADIAAEDPDAYVRAVAARRRDPISGSQAPEG